MIRRYLPKRTPIDPSMAREPQETVDETDNRPMRALAYRTPAEAFADELLESAANKDNVRILAYFRISALKERGMDRAVHDAGENDSCDGSTETAAPFPVTSRVTNTDNGKNA